MKPSSIVQAITFFGCVFFFISCTPREETTENPQSLTFETIEKGTTLEDARNLVAEEFTELKTGSSPDMDILMFEDGRQLVFIDKILTDKNTSEEIDEVVKERKSSSKN